MRYMFIVTSAQETAPTPALLEAMGKLTAREISAGRMIDNAGLMPASLGARVSLSAGKLRVLDGPFAEAKEVIGGYAILELRDRDEAVASALEFMQLHRDLLPGWDGTCEVRQVAGGPPR